MTALANRPFLRMNGIGNRIIVLDLRGGAAAATAADARAIGRTPDLAFDQLMVVYDPVTSGTAARMEIYNVDGSFSGACGNGTRCVAWALLRDSKEDRLLLESAAGLLDCRRVGEWRFSVDMGAPKFAWNEIPLAHYVGENVLHRPARSADCGARPAAVLRCQHGQSPCGFLCRRSGRV